MTSYQIYVVLEKGTYKYIASFTHIDYATKFVNESKNPDSYHIIRDLANGGA